MTTTKGANSTIIKVSLLLEMVFVCVYIFLCVHWIFFSLLQKAKVHSQNIKMKKKALLLPYHVCNVRQKKHSEKMCNCVLSTHKLQCISFCAVIWIRIYFCDMFWTGNILKESHIKARKKAIRFWRIHTLMHAFLIAYPICPFI